MRESTSKRALIAWGFLLPNFIGFVIFTAGPVLFSFYMAFTNWSLVKHNSLTDESPSFIGLQNFARLLWGDEKRQFWEAFYNTAYLMIGIPLGIAGSLIVALMLNRQVGPGRKTTRVQMAALALVVGLLAAIAAYFVSAPSDATDVMGMRLHYTTTALFVILGIVVSLGFLTGIVFFRTLFYLPSLLSGIALFLLWKSLYKPRGGAINVALEPVLDRLQAIAITFPGPVLYAIGFSFWLIGVAFAAWLGIVTLRKHREGDFGLGAVMATGLGLIALVATFFGLGYWCCQLPPTSLFATGFEPLDGQMIASIGAELMRLVPSVDPREIQITVDTLGGVVQPHVAIETFAALVPKGEHGTVRDLVMAMTDPVYVGYSAGEGLQPPQWLVDETWAKPALIIMGVWTAVGGGNMLLYLAGLSNIPEELYEASAIDGAGPWSRFWNVTWPQLAPTTFFIVIMSTIGGLQGGFDQARAMTGGKYGTEVLTYYLYKLAFTDEFQLGLASAVAWIMFAIIFFMTIVNYRFGSRMVND